MPILPLRIDADTPELKDGLARVREQFKVPGHHGPAAVEEAERAARQVLGGLDGDVAAGRRRDARDLDLVTIDPPGSRDLDQALHVEQRGGGWRVHYAIADVPAFVAAGGALDGEVSERGLTYYLPDRRSPLHPAAVGEEAGSLQAGQDRPAVLWTIDLDTDGRPTSSHLERAVVRSRAQLTYAEVQRAVDGGTAEGTLAGLAEVGALRQRLEAERHGVSLDLPTQRVVVGPKGYRLEHEAVVAAMGWNAQISLLTGMVAAEAMLAAGVGLLRTLPPPDADVVREVRRKARSLGVDWPEGASYQTVVRELDGSVPAEAALLSLAARGLRGAGYLPLLPGAPVPEDPDAVRHAAVASPYAHVTAPLRRLCDRAAIEVCLALHGGFEVPDAVLAALPLLPAAMARSGASSAGAARAAVDLVETLLLGPHVGEVFEATVVSAAPERSSIVLDGMAVESWIQDVELPAGETVEVRLVSADPVARSLVFEPL